jgi:hypothetical protein
MFILDSAQKLITLIHLIKKGYSTEALIQLQNFQKKIFFDFSHTEMMICERVYFHNAPQISFTVPQLKQAILRTCQELAIAGFTEAAKEKDCEAAEKLYENLFKSLNIWEDYQDERSVYEAFWDERNEKEEREFQIDRSFTALSNLLISFKNKWKYSSTK